MSTFWDKLKPLLPAIEMAGNVAMLATPLAPFEPMVAKLEDATQSAVQSIGTPQSVGNEALTLWAASIGVLETMKQTTNLPADVLNQTEGYLTASQKGVAAYVQAETGFNPANYTPVAPIA